MEIKKRDGRWHVIGYVVLPDGRRQRIRKSTGVRVAGAASKKLAEERAPDILRIAQLEAAGYAKPQGRTSLKKAIGMLISQKELAGRSQATIDIVLEKAAHLLPHFGPERSIGSITDKDLVDYARHARADKGEVKGRKPGTVHRELRTLREAMRAAGFEPPPMPDLGRVYVPRERWLDETEQRKLLVALTGYRRDYIVCYLHLGLSLSELQKIDRDEIDWDAGEHGQVYVRGTKAHSRARALPLTPEAREVFERAVKRDPMFPEWGQIHRDLKAACRRAGIDPCTTNDLRRSYATIMAQAGVPVLTLMHLMGHTSTRMLEKVYARVERGQHLHDAVRNLPSFGGTRAKYVSDDTRKSRKSDGEDGPK